MNTPAWRVEEIEPRDTLPLRALVLRPGWEPEECLFEHDAAPGTFHLGARIIGTGQVVAIMTVMVDDLPLLPRLDPGPGWRIRSMASHPEVRGAGCAAAIVRAGIERAWGQRPCPAWCNARRVAYGFYERLGFERFGDEFDIEDIGPHTVMVRTPR